MRPEPRSFRVRLAVSTDVAAICRLSRAIARKGVLRNEQPDPPALVRRRLGPLAFVAAAHGRVVGYAGGVVRPAALYHAAQFRRVRRVVDLDAAYVARRWRGRGVGSALVRRVLREARITVAGRRRSPTSGSRIE